MPPRYKFVELTVVTDETLERTVNDWVGQGWHLDAIRFVVGEGSPRPRMAFVSFVRDDGEPAEEVPTRSVIRRGRAKLIELGEIDPGEIEPFEAELDWANARRKRRAPPPAKKKK